MSLMPAGYAPPVFVTPFDVGALPDAEAVVARMLAGLEDYREREQLQVVSSVQGQNALATPISLQPLGEYFDKLKLPLDFYVCMPPRFLFRFSCYVNPGMVFDDKSISTSRWLPGMSSKVFDCTVYPGLAQAWPSVFPDSIPPWDFFYIARWEIPLNNQNRISRVNVGCAFQV